MRVALASAGGELPSSVEGHMNPFSTHLKSYLSVLTILFEALASDSGII